MEETARRFRQEAARHNRGRLGVRMRYPESLRRDAVSYFLSRQEEGGSCEETARELGVSSWSLTRWVRRTEKRQRVFRRVELGGAAKEECGSCCLVTPEGYRVEGLTVEGAYQLLKVLR